MSLLLDILGWGALCLGGFFCFVGAIGLNRMPDIFTRMHATSVSDTSNSPYRSPTTCTARHGTAHHSTA